MYFVYTSQIAVKSSLWIVTNEYNQVLDWKIVPNDSARYIKDSLERIWSTPNRKIVPQAHYTDHVVKDTNSISSLFKEIYPKEQKSIDVLQDIWHAQERVFRVMDSYHADFKSAKVYILSNFYFLLIILYFL